MANGRRKTNPIKIKFKNYSLPNIGFVREDIMIEHT